VPVSSDSPFRATDTSSTRVQKLEDLRRRIGLLEQNESRVLEFDGLITPAAFVVTVDATDGDVVVPLPGVAGNNGRELNIKKIDSSANTVTVTPEGAETIDGDPDAVLTVQWESVRIMSDGIRWLLT
jgi:hypothetical protein